MISFKNLQTNDCIEFLNEDSIGDYFLNTELFRKLTNEEIELEKLNQLKIKKIKQTKAEASKRIDAIYPQYKQLNNAAAVMEILNKENYATKQGTIYYLTDEDLKTLKKAKGCKDYINLIRLKSDLLETLINSKISTEDLTSIDISDDKYWI